MSSEVLLSEIFKVRSRFHRSINIIHDEKDIEIIDGYILTDLGKSVLARIALSLDPEERIRSWSITGPYGSGKSAFSLFLLNLLKDPKCEEAQRARCLLRKEASLIHQRLFARNKKVNERGYFPIIINGSRIPIGVAILDALDAGIARSLRSNSKLAKRRQDISRLKSGLLSGNNLKPEDLIQILDEFKQYICRAKGYAGLLMVIDELGKLLEYSALNPDQGDVFILQSLAELANRSGEEPLLLVTLLHQSFDRYAAGLSALQQQEWAKVQGRFEDIPFMEANDQILRLIGNAIERQGECDGLHAIIEEEALRAVSLKLTPSNMADDAFKDIIKECAPIHPTVALVLGPLFRSKLAQNERSLFAFMTSSEPFSLHDFLRSSNWEHGGAKPFYRLGNLYDYVLASMGSSLFISYQGKRWMEIEEALNRLHKDASIIEFDLVKSIGMLGILGDKKNIKASKDMLYFSLIDGSTVHKKDIDDALERLAHRKIIIFKNYMNAYALWEGSDIDFEERFKQGLNRLERTGKIAHLISRYINPSPIVAKGHLHRTGNFRYFKPVIIDAEALESFIEELGSIDDADGQVVYVLPSQKDAIEEIAHFLMQKTKKGKRALCKQTIFSMIKNIRGIQQALEEVLAWEWVKSNTPEMEGDRVAQREYLALLDDAKRRLDVLCDEFCNTSKSYASCVWIYQGERKDFSTAKQLSEFFSDVFDRLFRLAPKIHNELINRDTLSSSAAAARAYLMEKMIEAPELERFGIEGTPPSVSMYISLFQNTKLHRQKGDTFIFSAEGRDNSGIFKLWEGIDDYLDMGNGRRKSVAGLIRYLGKPPYGAKKGLIPVILLAKCLSNPVEIALFEESRYVPEPSAATFERLVRAPQRFQIQRYSAGDSRRELIDMLVSMNGEEIGKESKTIMAAVKPIYERVMRLPAYSKQTNNVSGRAIKAREILLTAKDPQKLIYQDLPEALGLTVIDDRADRGVIEEYAKKLKRVIEELERSYVALLIDIEELLRETFVLPSKINEARRVMQGRSSRIIASVIDLRLKAFAMRLNDTSSGDLEWLESIASFVASKPVRQWNDGDMVRFEVELRSLAERFKGVEEVLILKGEAVGIQDAYALRIGIIDSKGNEYREIVSFQEGKKEHVSQLADEVERVFTANKEDKDMMLASLAELARRIIEQETRG